MVFYRDPRGGADDPALGRGRRSSPRCSRSRCPAPASRASRARRPRSRRRASTTSASTTTRSSAAPQYWRIFELTGLDAEAEQARQRLAEHLEQLDVAARRSRRSSAGPTCRGCPRPADPGVTCRESVPAGRPSGRIASGAGTGPQRRAPGTPVQPRMGRAGFRRTDAARPAEARLSVYAPRNAAVVSAIQLLTRGSRAASTPSATTLPTWSRLVVIWATSRAAGQHGEFDSSPNRRVAVEVDDREAAEPTRGPGRRGGRRGSPGSACRCPTRASGGRCGSGWRGCPDSPPSLRVLGANRFRPVLPSRRLARRRPPPGWRVTSAPG